MWTLVSTTSPVPLHSCAAITASDVGSDIASDLAGDVAGEHAHHGGPTAPATPSAPADECDCVDCGCAAPTFARPSAETVVVEAAAWPAELRPRAVAISAPRTDVAFRLPFANGPPTSIG